MPFAVFEYILENRRPLGDGAVPPDRVPVTATEPRFANAVVALEKSGQVKNAHTAYNAMLKRWPESLAGQMGRGNTAYALKDLATAESGIQARGCRPPCMQPAAFNNLAQVLAESGQLDEALPPPSAR